MLLIVMLLYSNTTSVVPLTTGFSSFSTNYMSDKYHFCFSVANGVRRVCIAEVPTIGKFVGILLIVILNHCKTIDPTETSPLHQPVL